MKKWFVKGVLPILLLLFILWIFEPIYIYDGKVEWFYLWLVVGIPFGVPKFLCICLPKGYDLGGTLGIVTMGVIVSGVVGGCIAVYTIIRACCTLICEPVKGIAYFL